MKVRNNSLLWVFVGMLSFAFAPNAEAQDDLYYNPSKDASTSPAASSTDQYDDDNNVTRRYNDDDDEYYDEEDDYAYQYSSRIRRFHRPVQVVDYYDPFFSDLYFYDPFYAPGTSIYVYNYNDYWSYRRWQRYNRWNSWGAYNVGYGIGWNSWGWNSAYSNYNPYYNPWVVNNYYYDPYWTCNGYNPYYGNTWTNNYYNYDNGGSGHGNHNGGYSPQTYTGPRRHGSTVNPGYARIPDGNGRLSTGQKDVPVVEKSSRLSGRTAGDIEGPVKPATRGTNPATEAVRDPSKGRGTDATPSRVENGRGTDAVKRTPETTPRRSTDPATRNDGGYSPRPSTEPTKPARSNETRPTRRQEEVNTPRRSETPQQETRPARRVEERSSTPARNTETRPSRTESSPSRSETRSSSPKSFDSGSSSRGSSNSGSSNSSSKSSSGSSNSSSKSSGGGRRQ